MSKLDLLKSWQSALGINPSAQKYNLEALIELTANGGVGGGSGVQSLVESMPGYGSTLIGFWLPGYDMVTNEGAANNQVVKDWSGFGNDGLRGNSATPNTASPEGDLFDGTKFIQVPYATNMNTASAGAMTLGSVAAQSVASLTYTVSQNANNRAIYYINDGRVAAYFGGYRVAASNRVLNTLEHYMTTGDGSTVNVYKNGILSNGTTGSTYNISAASQPLYIGRRANSGVSFTGTISCVYMYVNSAQDANAAQINTTVNDILALV